MNKQQLASKIWESANKMRSKIEANEYKDYILGFIFYKFLSEKEEKYLDKIGVPETARKDFLREDNSYVQTVQDNIGYFISFSAPAWNLRLQEPTPLHPQIPLPTW